MADFTLQDLWWLKPAQPDNPLPAMQLGAQMVQHRARVDLQQAETANNIARTSLMRTETMAKLQLQTRIDASNAELAEAASRITDWSDPVQMKPVYDIGSRAGWVVGTKGWEGIINTHERAVSAKRMSANTESLIAARVDRTDFNNKKLALQQLLADHTIPLTDARVVKAQQEAALAERELLVKENNVTLRGRETDLKEKRFNQASWSPEDRIEFNKRTKVIDDNEKLSDDEKDLAIQEIREDIELKRQSRLPKVQREGLRTASPAETPPAVVAPGGTIRRQGGNLFQEQSDGSWKFIGPAQ